MQVFYPKNVNHKNSYMGVITEILIITVHINQSQINWKYQISKNKIQINSNSSNIQIPNHA